MPRPIERGIVVQKTNENLVKITKLLSDCQYHDGTSIGAGLNITRAAVWKAMKKLEDYNIPVISTKGKGYRLKTPLILLDEDKIKPQLNQQSIQFEILEKIDSTNEYLKKHIKKNKNLTVCLAEMQTQGKGRFDRSWYSPFGKNLYLSLYYPFEKDVSELSGLSLAVGLAICRAIEMVCKFDDSLYIKWPNDIVMNQKKLAGNLIEIQAESHGFCSAIVGVGVNVNLEEATDEDINQSWTSLRKLTNHYQDRNAFCAALINCLVDYLGRFAHSGLKSFVEEWKERDYLFGQSIQLSSSQAIFSGKGAGINTQGHLMLRLPDGSEKSFSSGDTTLLKK